MSENLDIKKQFTEEELEYIKLISDPILWAEKYLRDPNNPNNKLNLRWYQKKILSSRRRKKVIRAGRRVGKSVVLIIEILWKLFTRQFRRIVLITPYKAQITELWDVLEKMIDYSPEIKNSIKRKINNPQELELYNGSHLKCFTAGSKSSSKGTNIRSLSADDIYLDEADYLGEGALGAIEPLLLTSKDTTLWASSTPTGRRESFYKWATQSERLGYDAFHFPASVNPNWISIEDAKKRGLPLSDSQEYYYKSSKPESFYTHEILAEFGEEEEGVFKGIFLDENIYDFNESMDKATLQCYDPGFKQNKKNTYTMGIDWNNSVNGTQIVITEYLNEETNIDCYETDEDGNKTKKAVTFKDKYRLFYRLSLSSSEDSQLISVKKIIDLLNKYKIDHIYCDVGFGQTNIELLREYGKSNKKLDLARKLVPIDFGSIIEVLDPLKKTLEKKPMKPFIVYTAVNEIEKGNCILPLVEDDEGKLISQIRSYTVKRHSQTGSPIFSQDKDHTLIAWLLSIVGFHMEYSTLIHSEFDPNDVLIGKVSRSDTLMPYLNKVDRKTVTDNKSIASLFDTPNLPKPIISDKITMDPRFYNDTEKPESYVRNTGRAPWTNQITTIKKFNPNKRTIGIGSPTGRKLI